MLVSDPPDHLGKTTSNWKTEIFGSLRSRDPSKVPSTGTLAEWSKHKTPQETLGRFLVCQPHVSARSSHSGQTESPETIQEDLIGIDRKFLSNCHFRREC